MKKLTTGEILYFLLIALMTIFVIIGENNMAYVFGYILVALLIYGIIERAGEK